MDEEARTRLWRMRDACDWGLATMEEAWGFPPTHRVRLEVLALRGRIETDIAEGCGTPSLRGFQRSLACVNLPRRVETV